MSRFFRSRWFKIPFYTVTYALAAIGLFFTVTFLAIQFGWTKDGGSADVNNRYFQEMSNKYNQSYAVDSVTMMKNRYEALDRILVLNEFYPKNAEYILTALQEGTSELDVLKMLDAIDIQLKDNAAYQRQVNKRKSGRNTAVKQVTGLSAFEWMNISEWQDFKIAVGKDAALIDSVARLTGVEGRMIVSCLVAEQIRLFNSKREIYKTYIGPMKVLSVESKFSFGVTGIKENTARSIESHLKNPKSIYYTGPAYEHLLDFIAVDDTAAVNAERITRLTDYHNHYYSYMYAALFLKQMKMQWERSGYPIADRPEILATLFNLGYVNSKPKPNPLVGGAQIMVGEKPYTFGAIAFQFYYSGELFQIFPYHKKKFDWEHEG